MKKQRAEVLKLQGTLEKSVSLWGYQITRGWGGGGGRMKYVYYVYFNKVFDSLEL